MLLQLLLETIIPDDAEHVTVCVCLNVYRYSESVQQIQTLSREMSSSIDKGWFYAACMNFLLYAGMRSVSHGKIHDYYFCYT